MKIKQKHIKINKCIDCKKEISDGAKRCYSCNNVFRWKDKEYKENISKKVTKSLTGRKLTEETKQKISKSLKGKFTGKKNPMYIDGRFNKKFYCKDCNKEIHYKTVFYGKGRCDSCCQKGKLSSNYGKLGKESTRYIDGRTPLTKLIRDGFQNQQWIRNTLKKDNYTCQECGDNKGGNLNVHHIKPFSKILSELLEYYNHLDSVKDKYKLLELSKGWQDFWNLDNGITYCKGCHKKIHLKKESE